MSTRRERLLDKFFQVRSTKCEVHRKGNHEDAKSTKHTKKNKVGTRYLFFEEFRVFVTRGLHFVMRFRFRLRTSDFLTSDFLTSNF